MADDQQGGRIFFSNVRRSMEVEDEIELTSVGIDIGSSTSHLVFSRIVLERLDTRYLVVERTLLHQSDILLTPYRDDQDIDAEALRRFVAREYQAAGIAPDKVDTGALILTGVAVRRANARAIGELFAAETGKFVVVSAGDGLETTLAAFGSGAVARSARGDATVLNIDIGGGTSKLAICRNGAIASISALDIGARIIAYDEQRRIVRIEEAGHYFSSRAGLVLKVGDLLSAADEGAIVDLMAAGLMAAIGAQPQLADEAELYRLDPLATARPDIVTISGGLSEFFYDDTERSFSDLGPALARTLRQRLAAWGPQIEKPVQGIRATVVGASQYTVQVSGSTIFVQPMALLPLRSIPVIKPALAFDDEIEPTLVESAIQSALTRLSLEAAEQPVAVFYEWAGSATFRRLDGFCRGLVAGLRAMIAAGHPLVLVGEGDVGGLIGIHCHRELGVANVVSIDGIELDEFDFIDIGAVLETSGAVPVVVKSLVFPGAGLGRQVVEAQA